MVGQSWAVIKCLSAQLLWCVLHRRHRPDSVGSFFGQLSMLNQRLAVVKDITLIGSSVIEHALKKVIQASKQWSQEGTHCLLAVVFAVCSSATFWHRNGDAMHQHSLLLSALVIWCRFGVSWPLGELNFYENLLLSTSFKPEKMILFIPSNKFSIIHTACIVK